jgi:hypothetical protein
VCDIGVGATYTIFAIPDEAEARVLCTFKAPNISYMHSFALTENYFVLQVDRPFGLIDSHSRLGSNIAVIALRCYGSLAGVAPVHQCSQASLAQGGPRGHELARRRQRQVLGASHLS